MNATEQNFIETIIITLKSTLSPDKIQIENGQNQLSVLELKPGFKKILLLFIKSKKIIIFFHRISFDTY